MASLRGRDEDESGNGGIDRNDETRKTPEYGYDDDDDDEKASKSKAISDIVKRDRQRSPASPRGDREWTTEAWAAGTYGEGYVVACSPSSEPPAFPRVPRVTSATAARRLNTNRRRRGKTVFIFFIPFSFFLSPELYPSDTPWCSSEKLRCTGRFYYVVLTLVFSVDFGY